MTATDTSAFGAAFERLHVKIHVGEVLDRGVRILEANPRKRGDETSANHRSPTEVPGFHT